MEEKSPSDPDVIHMGWRSSRDARRRVIAVVALVAVGVAGYALGRVTAGPDVTVNGQISYACALAERVREGHQNEDDWGDISQDRAYSEISAIPDLLGLWVAPPRSKNDFADVGWDDLRKLRGDTSIGQVLDATLNECGDN